VIAQQNPHIGKPRKAVQNCFRYKMIAFHTVKGLASV
jgi:hypothetical protein